MATFEERLTLIEHEYTKLKNDTTELKKTMELQTIAIGALVNKAALERLNEKYDKLFDTLISHDRFTNEQLAELRGQQTELDGKIVGLQTETRQRFDATTQQIADVKQDVSSVKQDVSAVKQDVGSFHLRFDRLEKLLLDRLPPSE